MKRKKKCQFINLAEQLALQNDMVGQTMDSLLQFGVRDEGVAQRSDYQQIKKMAEGNSEFNKLDHAVPSSESIIPAPRQPSKTRDRITQPQD